jgi:alanine racemase
MFETSVIENSTASLKNNLKFIRKQMKPGVRLCSVVKGNAYGHGLTKFVRMAMSLGVDYFGVHSADEAYHLKENLTTLPDIFIMGAIDNEAVDWAVENNIEFSVFDDSRFESALIAAKKHNISAKIHIEIETGMRRTGFNHEDIPWLINYLKEHSNEIILQGIFTHFAGAENQANHFRVKKQIENFNLSLEQFADENIKPKYFHTACSAALLNYPDAPGNMVRIGILQYGFWPNNETHIRFCGDSENNHDPLKRVIRWTSKVMAIKKVLKGCFVGYGTSFLAHKNMVLAIIPVGYAHGYSRNLSNAGSVLINGKLAPIVGTINMNSLTVDVTDLGKVSKNEEVVLIGKQNGKAITVNSFSEQSNQLNYEMLTRLPYNIPRITNT